MICIQYNQSYVITCMLYNIVYGMLISWQSNICYGMSYSESCNVPYYMPFWLFLLVHIAIEDGSSTASSGYICSLQPLEVLSHSLSTIFLNLFLELSACFPLLDIFIFSTMKSVYLQVRSLR